ncbi:MAG: hypothetical protein R3F49_23170 [Planctomycetota bacterium]
MKDAARFADSSQPPALPFDLKVLLLYGIARYRGLIVGLAVVGAVLGIVFGASQPNVYTAEAKLRYQASARQLITDETVMGVSDPDPWSRRRSAPGIPDLMELLRDPSIYERVVQELSPREILRVEDPSKTSKGAGLFGGAMHQLQGFLIRAKGLDDPCPGGEGPLCFQAAVQTLISSVRIRAVDDTSLLQITYTATSPAKAQRILEAVIKSFIAHHLEVYGASGRLAELKEQFAIELEYLNKQNSEYREYQKQCGFYDIDGDYRATVEAIRVRDDSIREQEIRAKQLEKYVASLEAELNGEGSMLGGQTIDPTWAALVQQRRDHISTIADLETRGSLSTTQQNLLERSRKELSVVETVLKTTPEYTRDPFETALAAQNNPVVQQAQLTLAQSRAELASVASSVEAGRLEMTKLRERLDAIRECEPQHDFHQLSIAATQEKFNRIAKQIPELDTLAGLDSEGRSNLTVFRKPAASTVKDGPQRSKPFALGLFGGLGLGVGLAALRQLLDRRVRYRETIENALGLAVLCVVPEVNGLADGRQAA